MPDLAERITTAIDRAEQVARDVIDAIGDSPWVVEYLPTTQRITNARAYVIAETHIGSPLPGNRALWAPEPEHIALHDPAAVLRRCAADRKLLAWHDLDDEPCTGGDCAVLEILAEAWGVKA